MVGQQGETQQEDTNILRTAMIIHVHEYLIYKPHTLRTNDNKLGRWIQGTLNNKMTSINSFFNEPSNNGYPVSKIRSILGWNGKCGNPITHFISVVGWLQTITCQHWQISLPGSYCTHLHINLTLCQMDFGTRHPLRKNPTTPHHVYM